MLIATSYQNRSLYMLKCLAVGLTFMLSACSTQSVKSNHSHTTPAQAKAAQPAQLQHASIAVDTLSGLLLAEIAGQRQHYRYALQAYLNQAKQTQNAQIAERTLDIAKFVGDLSAQKQALDIWLKASPKNTQALARAAKFYLRQGDVLQAFAYMQQLEALNSHTPYHYLALFGGHLSTDKKQQLLAKISHQRSTNKDNQVNLLYAKGLLLQQLKHYQRAMQNYQDALRLDPKRQDVGLQSARLLLIQNKPQQALERVNDMHLQHPENKAIALLQARLFIHTKRQQKALHAFSALHQAHPFDGDILLSLALLELDMLQDNAAQVHLNKLLSQQQNLNQAHYYLGRLAAKRKQYDTAIGHFRLVAKSREYIPAKAQIVHILYAKKGAQTALQYVRKLQAQHAKLNLDFLLLEAEILIQDKQFEAAMQVYNKGINAYPKQTDLRYARAILAIETDNLSLAEQDLKHLLSVNPNDAKVLNTLGYTLLVKTQRIQEAKELITRAHKLNPESAAILDSLGWLYFKLGDLEEAKSLLEEAFAKSQDGEIAAHLGEVLWLRGNHDAAQEVWRKGQASDPENPIIKQTMERLNAH